MSKKLCIILVGPPCSGKSATGKLTASKMNIKYISSGDIAREMAKHDPDTQKDLSAGKMAPEDRMRSEINKRLWNCLAKEDKDMVILDGFPRFGDQAKWLRSVVPDNIEFKYVLFDVPLSTIIERSIHRGRDDDKSLEERLKYYYNTTFKEMCTYLDVYMDADENSVEECSALLIKFIKEVMNNC